jgi:hypothetical protein
MKYVFILEKFVTKIEKKSEDKSLTSLNGSSTEIPIEFLLDPSQFDEPQEESQSDEHPSTSKEAQATTTSKTKAQDELKEIKQIKPCQF